MIIRIDDNNNIVSLIALGGLPEGDPHFIRMNRDDVDPDILMHIYDYKFINGEFIFDAIAHAEKVERVKSQKILSMSEACHNVITNGIDFNGEHYSLSPEDQTNLTNLSLMSQTLPYVPYHADGQLCREYSAEEIQALATMAIRWVTFHTTYHNFLKAYIRTLNPIDDILDIHYGTELPSEYMTSILAIMGTIDLTQFIIDIPDTTNYDYAQRIIHLEDLTWEEDQPPEPAQGPDTIPEPEPDEGGDDDEETPEGDEPIVPDEEPDIPDDNP